MHYIVAFESGQFDLVNEKRNPLNIVHGISIGEWLSPLLESRGVKVTGIEPEDWGWYLDAILNKRKYLLGFVGLLPEKAGGRPELMIQVEKQRSLLDMLLFKNKMTSSDPMLTMIHALVSEINDAENVEVMEAG